MTDEEYFRLVKLVGEDIAREFAESYAELIRLLRSGVEPAQAIATVTERVNATVKTLFIGAISSILGEAVSADTYLAGHLTLSQRLYTESVKTSSVVESVITRHTKGFQGARALALELYEGYGFREEELLNLSPSNERLPKYLREALLPDNTTRIALSRAYARAQAKALKTNALRAAYTELLKAIDNVQSGVGQDYLDKKLKVAFEEKMRYYSNRIAQTELHRAYAIQQARELLLDDMVKYVQWRLNPAHPVEDICDYFAGVDMYGLGRGIYPKELAPVAPAHPFCKCVLSPLSMDETAYKLSEDADSKYFSRLSPVQQRKVAGSKKKLERIKAGSTAWEVHNSYIDPVYQVKTVAQVTT